MKKLPEATLKNFPSLSSPGNLEFSLCNRAVLLGMGSPGFATQDRFRRLNQQTSPAGESSPPRL